MRQHARGRGSDIVIYAYAYLHSMIEEIRTSRYWCDMCGECSFTMNDIDREEIERMIEKEGWKKEGERHYCKECAKVRDEGKELYDCWRCGVQPEKRVEKDILFGERIYYACPECLYRYVSHGSEEYAKGYWNYGNKHRDTWFDEEYVRELAERCEETLKRLGE